MVFSLLFTSLVLSPDSRGVMLETPPMLHSCQHLLVHQRKEEMETERYELYLLASFSLMALRYYSPRVSQIRDHKQSRFLDYDAIISSFSHAPMRQQLTQDEICEKESPDEVGTTIAGQFMSTDRKSRAGALLMRVADSFAAETATDTYKCPRSRH
uniref:Uncharacterized protein n=1 Tax=Vespula pensylvanica TaxID=30213 RepID=A0A834P4B7_VESPE|nr:hypothetical protein H0235_007157 [Vespula pensylvanica]